VIDYGGYGSGWIDASYRGVPVAVPEILHKIAGPRSTVRQSRYPSFRGMGFIRGDIPQTNYWPLLLLLGGLVLLSQKKSRH
jgi:hypothetical protein